jgi:hypothetical protein
MAKIILTKKNHLKMGGRSFSPAKEVEV